ncbi:MAG: pantoate--beta-alanine ligase, partial [Beggiatoa sp.]|nr:pantoate--beta-alanine ligase [Beggiatoa sp.]
METVARPSTLRDRLRAWQSDSQRIALVPTMGNLHAGHLALIRHGQTLAERSVVSVFVNPTQFVSGEDFERYPRTLEADTRLLLEAGVDLLFAPEIGDLYPRGLAGHTRVEVPALDHILCGASRPGHFTGVATVVTKLLNLVMPDVAVFGRKDYQQLVLIRHLVADLDLPVSIESVDTVREADGLALSSRNRYLNTEERAVAPELYRVLRHTAEVLRSGNRDYAALEAGAGSDLEALGFRPDYFAVRRASDLMVPRQTDIDLIVLAAAW